MRLLMGIIFGITLVALSAPKAQATSFTATFTCTSGSCSPGPSNTNNPVTFPSPTLDVLYLGITEDITLNSADASTDAYTWNEFEGGPFVIDDTTDGKSSVGSPSGTYPGEGQGALIFTQVGAPEPSSIALTLLGVWLLGLTLLLQKRNAHDLAPTT